MFTSGTQQLPALTYIIIIIIIYYNTTIASIGVQHALNVDSL